MKISKKLLALSLMAAISASAGTAFAGDWVLQLGGGISQPLSKQLSDNYSLGYNGSIALGYKASNDFTLSINGQVNSLGIKNINLIDNGNLPFDNTNVTAKSADFSSFQVSAIGKLYLMGVAVLRPYVFAGPGIAFNAYHVHTDFPGNDSDFQTDYATVETDFFATGGVGAELDLSGGLSVFAQAQFALDVTKSGASNIIADSAVDPAAFNSDSTSYYLPITAGINYNL
jgi:hypothetical protein